MESGPENEKKRRPYRKPLVRSSELFEKRALTCGIQPSTRTDPACGTYHQSV